jgi:hypothetical protein
MGTWSTSLFSDDTAADVRDAYRALLADGYSGPKATARLLRDWKETVDDEDDGPVLWLALAAAQWQSGRLQASVKARAIRIIDTGSALRPWLEGGDSKMLARRQAALNKLRVQLLSPQPAPKQPRKFRHSPKEWQIGDVLAYRLRSRRLALLHIANPGRGPLSGDAPIFAVLDWLGETPPEAGAIRQLKLKKRGGEPWVFMTVGRLDKK